MILQLYIWYQIKGPIIIFLLKGHAVTSKCVDYKIFFQKKQHDFCFKKMPF